MFDFFKKEESSPDVKALRQNLLLFIKDQLKRWEGGEGANLKGLQLFLSPSAEERHVYEAALFVDDPDKFKKEEVQRIADDYAIDLPADWTLEFLFVEALPAEAVKAIDLPVALHVSTKKQPMLTALTTAYLRVMTGEAEKEIYVLSDKGGKVCIGRERRVQTPEGFMRENNIAFPSESNNKSNKFISRQHAHIAWNRDAGGFFLYADEGGIPPRNKIKVQTTNGDIIRLQSIRVGHHLQEGDQIVLGESALLQFSYKDHG
ncbi:FHA domain-containing protein [Flavisolibacter ginsenosidimutans]|uniref:FHA domain-containing protein n=1 Tax=Flavisolibacter ginsenosidimutans TaxID=661481 RepID=A0A5B8UHF5_9BACT|nr:FHA domain-containing protein [Flavisolibacter ginsenosidimutans]QEC55928.1 FHA domain-containing protein [Flavisolibacter ginsenosidimutans]